MQPHVVYCSACKAVDGMNLVRDLISMVITLTAIKIAS